MTKRCLLPVLLAAICLGAAAPARAQQCPETAPEDGNARRVLAREWFSRAETAEKSGNDLAAIKAYSCSMKMVPHAFTAYNLGRVGEKAGDLDLALASYRNYLTLKPDASDRAEVERRIKSLEERIAAVRPADPTIRPADPVEPPRAAPPPPADPVAPPPAQPSATVSTSDDPAGPTAPSRMGTTEWVIAGVGAAALATGVVLNLAARGRMSDCHDLAAQNRLQAAGDACDQAKPYAYTSYGLFGLAAAAAVVDVVLIMGKGDGQERVSLRVLPGGASLALSGRF